MKPLVTCLLLTYNQENYIEDAVNSILDQDYESLEIIISDDCSSDETYRKICYSVKTSRSPHKVSLNRNEKNLGLTAHFNKLLELSNGEIIVVAAGDDISLKNRISKTVEIFSQHNDVSFISFNDITIDSNGNEIAKGQRVGYEGVRIFDLQDFLDNKPIPFSGASRAFKRSIYDAFGELNKDCPTEDTPYILRGLMMGNTAISSDIAIKYRKHKSSLSTPSSLAKMDISAISKQYISDIEKANSEGFMSSSQSQALIEWVRKNEEKRKTLNALEISDHKTLYLIKNIIFSSKYSKQFKKDLIKKSIYPQIKNLINKLPLN